jgi:CRISPR-associated protein Csb2
VSTAVALTFPWGLLHATPWGRHPNEGAVEWPPSPFRLLRALYATWRTRAPELDEVVVLRLLDALADAPEYHVPPHTLAHTRHYVPDAVRSGGWAEGTDKLFDAFAAFPRGDSVVVVWPGEVGSDERAALSALVRELAYVGRAESVCEARVLDAVPEPLEGWRRWRPVDDARPDAVGLLTPRRPFDPTALLVRSPAPATGASEQLYAADTEATVALAAAVARRRPQAIRWVFTARARPSVRATVTHGDILRAACQSRFGGGREGIASATLSGRDAAGIRRDNHGHAHYLSLDLDGDGLVDTLAVWAREGLGPDEVAALATLTELRGYGHVKDFRPGRLAVEALGDVGAALPELVGPARRWVSRTPYAPGRHGRRGTSFVDHVEQDVRREIAVRGYPEPSLVESYAGPVPWLSFRRHRPSTEDLGASRNATGLRITFDEPQRGPLALGALSHFGLGLFDPQHDD